MKYGNLNKLLLENATNDLGYSYNQDRIFRNKLGLNWKELDAMGIGRRFGRSQATICDVTLRELHYKCLVSYDRLVAIYVTYNGVSHLYEYGVYNKFTTRHVAEWYHSLCDGNSTIYHILVEG